MVDYAQRMNGLTGSLIRELLKLTDKPEVISFAGGFPSPDSFPAEAIAEIAGRVLKDEGSKLLQYGTTEGLPQLREWIASYIRERGVNTTPDNVLVLSGSQQGIDLISKVLLDPGDVVLVERPTYLTAINVFKAYQADIRDVEMDEFGLVPEKLEEAILAHKPKLLYTIPTFQNPSGVTASSTRREKLMEIVQRHHIVMVEDDPYGALRYDGDVVPYMSHFDTQGVSLLLGSFSKTISPGLRTGFAAGDKSLISKMVICKQGTDVHTSNLSQRIVAEFCSKGYFKPHLDKIIPDYKVKRDAMLKAMEEYFPPQTKWIKPEGGLFIWCELPKNVDTPVLLEEATRQNVAFIPGVPFFVDGSGKNTMRLNFSNASIEGIEAGMKRLGRVINEAI